ncbi:MAG: YihY/virulence factor BrkB family protein, partial [Candidatus Sumerlaeia bacterium]|nr:YihY/virulence factor BrkB family protein [Candidatus Sumerlaeia bacterium]
ELSPWQRYGVNFLRILTLSIQHFFLNKCMLRASALTFYTMLSIVPMVAVALGIAKGFGMDQVFQQQLESLFPSTPAPTKEDKDFSKPSKPIPVDSPKVSDSITTSSTKVTTTNADEQSTKTLSIGATITDFAERQLAITNGGLVAGIGIIFLFFTVIRMIGNIEESLNAIWNVKEERSLARKLSDYLSLIIFSPIVLIMSSSLNILLSQQKDKLIESIPILSFLNRPAEIALKSVPLLLIIMLLSFIYAYLPNKKVRLIPAVMGGIVAGLALQFFQLFYIFFQKEVSNYGAIYAGLAALPLFMFYLQMTWSLLLFGAEVSFAAQNSGNLEYQGKINNVSDEHRAQVALAICAEVVRTFMAGQRGPTGYELSLILATPERYVNQVIQDLLECQVLSVLAPDADNQIRYAPALDTGKLTVNLVLQRLNALGTSDVPLVNNTVVQRIRESLGVLTQDTEASGGNRLIRDLLD